jgi:oxygen-dependent protoporphyrinogen oxidase
MKPHDIIIVGGGVSGLSMACYCGRAGYDTVLIEQSGKVGGAFDSPRFGQGPDAFWLELGAHTCYNSYANFIGILEESGAADRMIPRRKASFRMLVDGGVKSISSQLDFLELLLSVPHLLAVKRHGQSVRSYYRQITGKKNFDRVFAPAFNAVISQDAGDFPADLLFQRRKRRKDIMKKFTFQGGLQTVADILAAQPNIEIRTGTTVRSVAYDGKVFSVSAPDGLSLESSALALAVPAASAAGLLRASFPEVSRRLSPITVSPVESVGVVVKKEAIPFGPIAGLIPCRDSFYSMVSRDPVPHDLYRGFTFHFKPGMLDDGAKIQRISDVLRINAKADLVDTVAKTNYVPSLRVGHERLIGAVDGIIAGTGLFLTGNFFGGMAIEDCVSRSLQEFLRLKHFAGDSA